MTYHDLEGREFKSLPELCRENQIYYNKCYKLYKKGMPLEDAIRECLGIRGDEVTPSQTEDLQKSDNKDKSVPSFFRPKTIYPGREYLRYWEWVRDYWQDRCKDHLGMHAVEDFKHAEHAQQMLDSIEPFWLGAIDAIVCGDEQKIATLPEKTLNTAKMIAAMVNAEKETEDKTYYDIYVTFARKYHLGRYTSSENSQIEYESET